MKILFILVLILVVVVVYAALHVGGRFDDIDEGDGIS